MYEQPSFNLDEAHTYFSVESFNTAWRYIEQTDPRTNDDKLAMLHAAIVSLWHWSQRRDVSAENLSTGYWQVARVFNLIRQPHNARTYGLLALKQAEHLPPLFKARACEALARAEMISGNRVIMTVYLDKARALAKLIEHEEDRAQLVKDLDSIC